ALRLVLAQLATSAQVFTGCARGIDAAARRLVPAARLRVFRVQFGGRGGFAARSIRCVRAVAAAGGLWCSFPAGACPSSLSPSSSPSACFSGSGSGTWASLAFALGLGLPALVFLPSGVSAPAGWGLSPLGSGWWWAPGTSQPSLFG